MEKKANKSKSFSIFWLVIGTLLAVYAISLFIPMIWGFTSSFKSHLDFQLDKLSLPEKWLFSNYSTVIDLFYIKVFSGTYRVYIPEMLLNSVLYAVGSAFIQAFVQFIMAYLSSRFDFKFGKVIYTIVILGMVIPIVGSEPSAIAMADKLNIRDSIFGLYLMKSYFLGMYFLIFFETLKAFPKDYTEAAEIDGAGNFSIMFRIMFPLCINTFFTISLLLFIQFWNDYTTPMLFMPNVPTLAYGLYYFIDLNPIQEINTMPMRLSACIMMLVPTLTIFLIFHNKLLSNVTIGGVKE